MLLFFHVTIYLHKKKGKNVSISMREQQCFSLYKTQAADNNPAACISTYQYFFPLKCKAIAANMLLSDSTSL
jgi:hypothetical protein